MGIETVVVNGERYNVAQASAVKQKSLMAIISKRLMWDIGVNDVELDQRLLAGTLMGMPEDEFDKVAEIVLYKTAKEGSSDLVTIEDFQGRIFSYVLLCVEAVRINLADLLGWLGSAQKPTSKANQGEKATSIGT